MKLSSAILRYRAYEDISQAEFAARVKLDRTTILRAERDEKISRLSKAKIEVVLRERGLDQYESIEEE